MLSRRRSSIRPKQRRQESLWKRRKTTIQYLLYFAAGLLLGSLAAVLCGVESIPYRILENQIQAIPEQGLFALWRERLLFMAILLLYLMIAGQCLWGNGMIPVASLLFGLGQGTVVSLLLILLGLGGIGFILLGFILPRTVQLAALILLCNLAHNSCGKFGGDTEVTGQQTVLWLFGAALLTAGTLLEAVLKLKLATTI